MKILWQRFLGNSIFGWTQLTRRQLTSVQKNIRNVSSFESSVSTNKIARFSKNTLRQKGIYKTHLLYRPLTIALTELEALSVTFQDAASHSNVSEVLNLAAKVPEDATQVCHLVKRMELSRTVGFNLALQEHLNQAIESLNANVDTGHVDNDLILSVVHTLFYTQWFTTNDLNMDSCTLAAIEAFDKVMGSSTRQIPLSTWCRFIQWRLTVEPKESPLYIKFLRDVTPMCQSTKDVLAVSMLLGPVSDRLKYDWWKLESCFATIALQNRKLWYDNEELMGVLCCGLGRINRFYRIGDTHLLTLLWDIIVRNIKQSTKTELSTALECCIKQAAVALHELTFTKHPFLIKKCLSSIEAIHSKLVKMSPTTSIYLFWNMVQSRHIHEPVARKLIQSSVDIIWQTHQVHKVAGTIYAMANYGCTDATIYSPLFKLILSDEFSSQLSASPVELLTILQGLSYIHVFPHKLLAMLFARIQEKGSKPDLLSQRKYKRGLLYLDGTLPILCPSYNGPRLHDQHRKMIRESVESKPVFRHQNEKDGIPTRFSMMMMLTRAAVESLPSITNKYIVQVKSVPEHFLFDLDDIVLTTTDPSAQNVVIVLNTESSFLKLYSESQAVSMQLSGYHKSRITQLKKLGYIVVTISFDEHARTQNYSQLVKDKLEAAGVL